MRFHTKILKFTQKCFMIQSVECQCRSHLPMIANSSGKKLSDTEEVFSGRFGWVIFKSLSNMHVIKFVLIFSFLLDVSWLYQAEQC